MNEPVLSSDLASRYSLLPPNYKRLFVKLFRFMFDYLLPKRMFTSNGGVLYNYWLVNQLREKNNLSVRELDLLTLLYNHSSGGHETIRTDKLKEHFPDFSNRLFVSLRKKRLITRHTFDPCAPHYSSHRSIRPVFVRLTLSGIRIIKDIENNLRYALFHTVLKNITSDSGFTEAKTHQVPI